MYLAIRSQFNTLNAILFSEKVDLEIQDEEGNTVLILAAAHNNVEFVENIINKGANVYVKNKKGESVLSVALKNYNKYKFKIRVNKLLKILIKNIDNGINVFN